MTPDDRLRATLRTRPGLRVSAAGPDCFDPDRLADLVEGTLDAERRSDTVRHLARCEHCRQAVASLSRALEDPAVAGADPNRRRPVVWMRVAASAAAIAVAVAIGREWPRERPADAHRAPVSAGLDRPAAVSPLGPAARPSTLRWHPVAGADRYRLTLYGPGGEVLYETELRDTATPLPDSVVLYPGRPYLWKVEARTDWNRWTSSPLFRFSLPGGRQP